MTPRGRRHSDPTSPALSTSILPFDATSPIPSSSTSSLTLTSAAAHTAAATSAWRRPRHEDPIASMGGSPRSRDMAGYIRPDSGSHDQGFPAHYDSHTQHDSAAHGNPPAHHRSDSSHHRSDTSHNRSDPARSRPDSAARNHPAQAPRAGASSTSSDHNSENPKPTLTAPSPTPPSLTQAALARLQSLRDPKTFPSRPERWPLPSSHHSYHPSRRVASATPSVTSVSDGEGDGDGEDMSLSLSEEKIQDWVGKGQSKGKGKAVDEQGDQTMREGQGLAGSLPPEVLVNIFRLLPEVRDLQSTLLVSRTWCLCTFSLLWQKPALLSLYQVASLVRVLSYPSPSLPYAKSVRRLNLANVASGLTDELFDGLRDCSRVERLTLTGATHLSAEVLTRVLGAMPELGAVDLSNSGHVDDQVVISLLKGGAKLQSLNLSGCKSASDVGISEIARSRSLRRLKLASCDRVTDVSLVAITQACPYLLEVDLAQIPQLTNASVYSMFLRSCHVHDLHLNGNTNLTDEAIPNLPQLMELADDDYQEYMGSSPWRTFSQTQQLIHTSLFPDGIFRRPASDRFEHLRVVDLTGCSQLGDKAIDNLVTNAPKLRNLTLAKCTGLSDASLDSICRLGKNIHYLHLGHVEAITDAAVIKLARACTRLRYIDLACCVLLTDESVFELAENLPKLRRIGLVKVNNITDEAIFALVERDATLERIHLSYCDKVTVKAVTFMLNRLLRLTHLSLTGVSAFKTTELQKFCRPAPPEFNDHQQSSFCVYSGHGVNDLRHYLNSQQQGGVAGSDEGSTRRDSASSASSITVPGTTSFPIPPASPHTPRPATEGIIVNRRDSVPSFRSSPRCTQPRPSTSSSTSRAPRPGLPGALFSNATRSFMPLISPDNPNTSPNLSVVRTSVDRATSQGISHSRRAPQHRGARINAGSDMIPLNSDRERPSGPRSPGAGRSTPQTPNLEGEESQSIRSGIRRASDAGVAEGGGVGSSLRWITGMMGLGGQDNERSN